MTSFACLLTPSSTFSIDASACSSAGACRRGGFGLETIARLFAQRFQAGFRLLLQRVHVQVLGFFDRLLDLARHLFLERSSFRLQSLRDGPPLLLLERPGTNVNMATTMAIVTTGSITRREWLFSRLELVFGPSRIGTISRLPIPDTSRPVFKSTTNVAPNRAVEWLFVTAPKSKIMMKGIDTK